MVLSDFRSYASRLPVRAILFLAAPHKGINVEALETLVNGRPSQMMIAELRTGSPTLLDLNAKFAEVAYGIEIHSFFETMETPTVRQNENGILSRSGQAVTMVDRDSACLYCLGEHCHSVDANHSQIAKIKKGQAGIFPQVKSAIQSALIPTAHIVAKDYPEPSRDYSYYGVPQWMPPPPVYSLNKRTSFYSNISATQSAWGLQPRYPDGYSERASSPMHFAAESQPQRQIRTPSFGPTSGPEQFPTYAPNRLSTPAIETGDGLPKSVATSEAAEGIDREVFRPEPRGREISSTSTEDYAIPLIVTPDECEAAPKERSLSSKILLHQTKRETKQSVTQQQSRSVATTQLLQRQMKRVKKRSAIPQPSRSTAATQLWLRQTKRAKKRSVIPQQSRAGP
ncbi:hypothetical protein HDK90DRAFT_166251 [Phyllosticta capitalensis]|uniref:Uncharacterized protein n=1 Tax=Phyllosticta capitalensis TaxID=121624 RepID=A0ABR1Z171_9PEZI